jgi:hypothetical protein
LSHTYSALAQFQECPRKYFYKYVKLWRPIYDGVPKPVGTAVHAGVAALIEGKGVEEAVKGVAFDAYRAEISQAVYDKLEPKEQRNVDSGWMQVEAMVAKYKYAGHFAGKVIAQELVYSETVPNTEWECVYEGRLDRVVLQNGTLWVHDLKTTGYEVAKMIKPMRLRHQFAGYAWLLSQNMESLDVEVGTPVGGILLDLIYKPRVYWRKDGTCSVQEPVYHQEPLHVGSGGEFLRWVEQVSGMIEDCGGQGEWPMNTGSCYAYNKLCPYYEMCRNPLRAEGLVDGEHFEEVEEQHTELV